PLIISGPADEATKLYVTVNKLIRPLLRESERSDEPVDEDGYIEGGKDNISKKKYEFLIVDEKSKTVSLKETGVVEAEKILNQGNVMRKDTGLYDMSSINILHHVEQALRAHVLFTKDVDYVVKDGEVIIVDEFTGRLMPGRRYSDGLHQALEAKERVKVQEENVTLATITFQNYFRIYDKLAGMTGTADTEAAEFHQTYKLDVAVIPTNQDLRRHEHPDMVFRTEREKLEAVIDEIAESNRAGRPILVGTISIEKSEELSDMLRKRKVPHHVLNAKQHEREAEIIAQSGRKGAVTISTNMAGRGTDILLGGNPEFLAAAGTDEKEGPEYEAALKKFQEACEKEHQEVVSLGGLHVVGTERHESRRIDNQLRGRAGRQGDPGSSRFYLSLEDDLLRIFGSDRISGVMERLGMEEGVPIEAKMVSKAIENAQKKVEAHHFEMRKHLLEYDDVMNKQREIIYGLRNSVLEGEDVSEQIGEMAHGILDALLDLHFPESEHFEEWNLPALVEAMEGQYGIHGTVEGWKLRFSQPFREIDVEDEMRDRLAEQLHELIDEALQAKYAAFDQEIRRDLERIVYLQVLDTHWKDHISTMEHLKEGIGLRGYAQVNPLNEYKREGFEMFEELNKKVESETIQYLYRLDVDSDQVQLEEPEPEQDLILSHPSSGGFSEGDADGAIQTAAPVRRATPKVGRNEPCPCGSGKKYKHCHGK
ncbi:MAG: preprotein translocase subunit SecA, partial [bacterium]|nr:preprotein translocase subunit SecA [bacterium]